jgi:hypothetical protein
MEIGNQPLFMIHDSEWRMGVRFRKVFQKRTRPTHRSLNLPESIAAMKMVPTTEGQRRGIAERRLLIAE